MLECINWIEHSLIVQQVNVRSVIRDALAGKFQFDLEKLGKLLSASRATKASVIKQNPT